MQNKHYSIDDVFSMVGEEHLNIDHVCNNGKTDITVDDYKVHRDSMRYATFYQKGTKCVCCGKEGAYFQLDTDKNQTEDSDRRHFNLYAEDGTLITKDHILPKKWGGEDVISNFQTMCVICNQKKGSIYEHEIDGIIATDISNPNNVLNFINIEKALNSILFNRSIISQKDKPGAIASKTIKALLRLQAVIDTDTQAYGYYWKHDKFTVHGSSYADK